MVYTLLGKSVGVAGQGELPRGGPQAAPAAVTKHHRPGDLSDRNLFLHSCGTWRSKMRMLTWWGSWRGPSFRTQAAVFLSPKAEKVREEASSLMTPRRTPIPP